MTMARPRRQRAVIAAAIVPLVALLVLLVPPGHAGRWPRYGGALRITLGTLPSSLDPLRLGGEEGAIIAGCLYEGLTRWDSAGVGPALARRWTHDEEGQRWRFELRADAVFRDGTRCDAAAVGRALERLADPRQSSYAWLLSDLAGWEEFAAERAASIEGIDVLDATSLELRFEARADDIPARLALPVAAIARRKGSEWIGTGPFELASTAGGTLQLVAARQHAGGRPYLNRVEFVGAPDTAATEWSALRIARVLPGDAGPSGVVRVRSAAARLGFLLVNPQSEVLGSDTNRRQLSQSFDRSVFVRIVLGGDGEASEDLLPGALRRIENRGHGSRGNLGISPGARARILVSDGEPVLRALGERLFVHLYALGLAADLVVCPAAEFRSTLAGGRFDIAVLGWTPPQPVDEALLATTALQFFAAGSLQPALGGAFPEAWAPGKLAAAKDPAEVLQKSDLCIPLVFFHDVWQMPAEVLHLEPGRAGAGLGLESAHLEPRAQ